MAWVTPFQRTPVDQLLRENEGTLQEIRSLLSVGTLPKYADDVWLLRYALSFKGKVKPAANAALKALTWRTEPYGAAVTAAARARKRPPGFSDEELRTIDAYLISAFHHSSSFEDPVLIIRAGLSNTQALMNTISVEKMVSWYNYFNEIAFQYCEAQTRRLGYFVKVITLQDLNGIGFVQEQRFFKAMGTSSKMNEWLFPQLIGKTILLNSPCWFNLAFAAASKVMSPKSMEKVCNHQEPLISDSETSRLVGTRETLPTFLGGLCQCEVGCIGKIPNAVTVMRNREEGANHPHMLSAFRGLPRVDDSSSQPQIANQPATHPDMVCSMDKVEDADGLIWYTPPGTPREMMPEQQKPQVSSWSCFAFVFPCWKFSKLNVCSPAKKDENQKNGKLDAKELCLNFKTPLCGDSATWEQTPEESNAVAGERQSRPTIRGNEIKMISQGIIRAFIGMMFVQSTAARAVESAAVSDEQQLPLQQLSL